MCCCGATFRIVPHGCSVWGDDERASFIDWIAQNPEAGDVIPGATPLRKVRWGRAGTGKRGGVRGIYYTTSSSSARSRPLIIWLKTLALVPSLSLEMSFS